MATTPFPVPAPTWGADLSAASDRNLEAVIFDVDGTLFDSERHGHRVAFNLAFEKLGLPYQWDEELYGELLHVTGGVRRIEHYLAGQGVPEDGRHELARALHEAKTDILNRLVDDGRVSLRPGVARLVDELVAEGIRVAVATTGSASWVNPLLRHALRRLELAALVTGDQVKARKPDPEAYLVAMDRLGVGPETAVAVEDSEEGLRAAKASGLPTAVVANDYTLDHDFSAADLVLDGFGAPDRRARVLADPFATGCRGILDLAALSRLLEAANGR